MFSVWEEKSLLTWCLPSAALNNGTCIKECVSLSLFLSLLYMLVIPVMDFNDFIQKLFKQRELL